MCNFGSDFTIVVSFRFLTCELVKEWAHSVRIKSESLRIFAYYEDILVILLYCVTAVSDDTFSPTTMIEKSLIAVAVFFGFSQL